MTTHVGTERSTLDATSDAERPVSDAAVPRPVPIELWGKDHWSTFAYLETRAVDNKGVVGREQMRCDPAIHPGLANSANRFSERVGGAPKRYPTRLKDGEKLYGHDDWSCFEDFEAYGLVVWEGTGINPVVRFTDEGYRVAGELRRWKADGGAFAEFEWTMQLPDNGDGGRRRR